MHVQCAVVRAGVVHVGSRHRMSGKGDTAAYPEEQYAEEDEYDEQQGGAVRDEFIETYVNDDTHCTAHAQSTAQWELRRRR